MGQRYQVNTITAKNIHEIVLLVVCESETAPSWCTPKHNLWILCGFVHSQITAKWCKRIVNSISININFRITTQFTILLNFSKSTGLSNSNIYRYILSINLNYVTKLNDYSTKIIESREKKTHEIYLQKWNILLRTE